jgi:hypothetical protein
MPTLQSKDMQAAGGGYDTADPHAIERHVRWGLSAIRAVRTKISAYRKQLAH